MCGEMLGYGYPQVVSPCLNILDSIFWSAITTNQSYTRRASFIYNGEHEDFVPKAGEKELLRTCLYGENPWQHSETGSRLRSWERTAEAASSFTTITVEDSDGIHEVDARAVQGACMNEAAVDRLIRTPANGRRRVRNCAGACGKLILT